MLGLILLSERLYPRAYEKGEPRFELAGRNKAAPRIPKSPQNVLVRQFAPATTVFFTVN